MLIGPHIDVLATAHLDLPGLEPRGAVRADLLTPLGPLRVIGTHLGLIRRYRVLQIAAIYRHLSDLPQMPTVLAADMNEWGATTAMEHAAPGLCFVTPPPSFPALRPLGRLDCFAVSGDLRVQSCGTYQAQPARIASDHLPVWIDLALHRA